MDEYNSLDRYKFKRVRFDPKNKDHLKQLGYFNKHRKWKISCPFLLEWPYKDVITMCKSKYTEHMLKSYEK